MLSYMLAACGPSHLHDLCVLLGIMRLGCGGEWEGVVSDHNDLRGGGAMGLVNTAIIFFLLLDPRVARSQLILFVWWQRGRI